MVPQTESILKALFQASFSLAGDAGNAMIRRILFWSHFAVGVAAGLVILVMSVTGVLLAFERQILDFADRDLRTVGAPANAPRRPLGELLATVGAAAKAAPAVTVLPDAAASVQFTIGRGRVLYADPYTGAVLGESSPSARAFFSVVERWHRALGAPLGSRGPLRSIAAAANLLFLVLTLTGCYLWLPRQWSWKAVRAAGWFRSGLSSRARDWNWHNATGLWCAVPLVFLTLTGVIISYPWANALLFRLSGSPVPVRREQGGQPPQREREAGRPQAPAADLDRAVQVASLAGAGWRTMSLQIPRGADSRVTVTLDASAGGEVEKRTQLLVDSRDGRLLKTTTFADNPLGQRLRGLVRFLHTGEELGLAGQIIAAIASLGACLLVWTGFTLAWHRLRAR
jgi:uncharacterized iron-regulated membrane protein